MPQQQTRTELDDLTYSNLPNNTAGFIDPEKLREVLLTAWASLHNLLDDGNLAPGNGSTTPAQQVATFGNLGGAAQDNGSLVNYLASLGHTLTEFTPPMLAQQGRWYLAGTGIWEAKSNFNAGALPAPGAYWRRLVDFGDALTATDAGKALLAAPTALVQRNLLDIFSVPANTYGQGQPGFTNLYKEDGAVVYLLKKVDALAIQLVANSPAQATGPTVTGFLPGAAVVGASITLTGTGFTKATAVLFNGTPASFQVINATTIVAVVPLGATSGPIAVTTAAGTGTSAANFTVSATATPTPTGDTTKPAVSITIPTAGAILTAGVQVMLTASATDNVAVQDFVFVDGATGTPFGNAAKNGNKYTLPYTPTTTGPLAIKADAIDAAGNEESATVNVTVQAATTTPAPTGIAPPAPTSPATDDTANTFTYLPGGVTITPFAPASGVADDTANTFTYTPATI